MLRLLIITIILFPVIGHAAVELDLPTANEAIRQIRKNMDLKNLDFAVLKNMLDTTETLHDRAVDCIDKSNAQLQAITEIEKDNGMTDPLMPDSEDALYIQNKKKLQAARLAECRLFVFKTQDLMVDLKQAIQDANTSNMLTATEPMWEVINKKDLSSAQIIKISLVSIAGIFIIWCLWMLPNFKFMYAKKIAVFYRILIGIMALTIITLELIGYRQLAIYLSEGALLTIALSVVFILVVYLSNTFLVDEQVLKRMAITKKRKLLELKLLKFSIYALTGSWFILLLLEWWGVPLATVTKIKDLLLNGETIYGIKIIPMRLLTALLVFSLIQILGKFFAVYISRQNKFDGAADTQVAISSLITYIVFSIALLCGLLVSGVDFTGLAIVAGALSVGIGLGLQNVVNNFVSGIILLVEKSVRPGDRIMIKGTEGFVKKINFRYTRIVTLLKEDMIIPNSELITNPVINYVFHDKLSMLKCIVGVAYNSDIELVKETLLNVALKHPEVLRDPLNKPVVALKEFGENNLVFELYCVVADVNKKSAVSSDINFLIIKAFRENNIVIASPQLEIRIEGKTPDVTK